MIKAANFIRSVYFLIILETVLKKISQRLEHVNGNAIPVQGSRTLRFPDFQTIGTRRGEGCEPYAPAVFTLPPTPQGIKEIVH